MDVSPVMIDVGDQGLPEEGMDKDDDEDLCRICRSPEEAGNPLRHPCACRGSIKYVHQDCLRLWLNRRGYKKCEVCGRSYSFVPVYSENAPERLPCNEFLIGVLLRVARYMKSMFPWIVVFLFNTYCNSLHPWGQEIVAEFQRDFWMSRKFAYLWAGLIYSCLIVCFMAGITVIRMEFGDLNVRRNFIGNGLEQGVIGGAVQVLWKYFKILCDWYIHKLIYFLGPPNRRVLVPPNASLDEYFGVIRNLLFFLHDDAFAALAVSVCVFIFLVLLPICIGWIVLATVGGSHLSGNSIVICGYMMMLSIPLAYFGILFTLRHNPFPAIVRWFSLGFYFSTVELPVVLWVISVKACRNLYVIKDAFVLTFKIGVVPWIIGCWLEIYTSPMFRTTIPQRSEILSHYHSLNPLSLLAGFCFFYLVDAYRELIQEIIHKRAFWYLLDVRDPDYKVTKLKLGYTFFAFATYGVLLVILVHLPIKAITLISPSFFPLKLWVTDENGFLGAYVIYFNLMKSGLKWLIKLTKPAMELMIHKWIITVSSWLQLSDYLLVVPRGDRSDQIARPIVQPRRPYDDNKWFLLYSLAEGSMVILHGYESDEDNIKSKDQRDNRFFLLRIALMLVLAALSMFLFATAFMALPIFAGRVFFDSTPFIMTLYGVRPDDLCAFWMGCYILQAIYFGTCFVFDQIQKGRTGLLLKDVFIRIRIGLFFSIWISVIPGLLGLLIDLMIIIPSRVSLDESPVYFLVQDWWIGFFMLHVWTFLTMLTPNWFATKAWRGKLERIKNVEIDRLPSMFLLRDVIGSIINTLLTTLSIPYLLVKSLFPLLGFSQSINSAAERLIWPALLALITVWFMAKLTRDLIIYLHQLVFNERYLVGERVDNLIEELE